LNSLIEVGLVQVALIARSGVTGKKVEYLEAMLPIAKQRKFDL
jgi:hypothetical protein